MFQAIVRLCAGLGQNTNNNKKKYTPLKFHNNFPELLKTIETPVTVSYLYPIRIQEFDPGSF